LICPGEFHPGQGSLSLTFVRVTCRLPRTPLTAIQ
jgi:hypothetical protein